MRERKVVRMNARFWKTSGMQCHTHQGERWEEKCYLAADDTFSFVLVEGEVMLDCVEGSPGGSFWNV